MDNLMNTTNNATENTNNTADNRLPMDKVMDASFGEVSNKLTVTFKKTVLVRSYETEVIEQTASVEFDHKLTAIERMFVTAMLEVQMEYTAYCSLVYKGMVTSNEFNLRKKTLEEELYSLKCKADTILGPGVIDKYIDDNLK